MCQTVFSIMVFIIDNNTEEKLNNYIECRIDMMKLDDEDKWIK